MEEQNKPEKRKGTPKPVNQKSVYHSFSDIYEKIMNDDIPIEKAEQAINALQGMNRTYALEIKRAELEKAGHIRRIESKNFEEGSEQKELEA